MADEADMAEGYADRIVEESLRVLRSRHPTRVLCSFCEEELVEVFANGAHGILCRRCREEKENEQKQLILPIKVLGQQGDNPEDTWIETMIPSNRYKKHWMIKK